MFKFVLHFLFLVVGIAYIVRRSERFYWAAFAVFMAGFVANAVYGIVQLGSAEVLGHQPRPVRALADHGRREPDQHLRGDRRARASSGRMRSRATRTTWGSSS